MSRKCYVDHRSRVVVFWSPKVANTTITKVFALNIANLRNRKDLQHNGFQMESPQAFQLLRGNESYQSIYMIRDPYERLISVFLEKFVVNSYGKPITSMSEMEAFAKNAYNNMISDGVVSAQSEYKGITFRQFIAFVCDRISWRYGAEPKLNDHWNTQIPFFLVDRGFRFDNVFPFGCFEEFFSCLAKMTGRDIERRHDRKHSVVKKDSYQSEDLTCVRSVDLCTSKLGQIGHSSFDVPDLRAQVNSCYSNDYELWREAKAGLSRG